MKIASRSRALQRRWDRYAVEGKCTQDIFKELPGGDRNWLWRFSNLGKAQGNPTSSNILTASVLVNRSFALNENGVLNSKGSLVYPLRSRGGVLSAFYGSSATPHKRGRRVRQDSSLTRDAARILLYFESPIPDRTCGNECCTSTFASWSLPQMSSSSYWKIARSTDTQTTAHDRPGRTYENIARPGDLAIRRRKSLRGLPDLRRLSASKDSYGETVSVMSNCVNWGTWFDVPSNRLQSAPHSSNRSFLDFP